MLQRPQTVYLLLAAALLVVLVSLGDVWGPGVTGTYPWLGPVTYALAVAAALVALVAIAQYKDRKRQRTTVGVAQLLDLALLLPLLAGLFTTTPGTDVDAAGSVDAFGLYGRYLVALVPLVAYVLLRMARRGVDRDIATVRSMDRIR
ncbi:MAG TPA: DUF4293 family protein [Rubricoccaceae bacterium]|jgi:hypothetical protein